MQARTATRATYPDGSTEYSNAGREEHFAQLAAELYMTCFVKRLAFTVASSCSPWSAV
jgi:hypothetical protein